MQTENTEMLQTGEVAEQTHSPETKAPMAVICSDEPQEIVAAQTLDQAQPGKKKPIYRNPQFWVAACCGLTVICILLFVLVELAKPAPRKDGAESTTQSTQMTQATEATLPPLPANPIGLGDFELKDGYLTCLSTPSVLGIDVSEWQGEIDWQQVKDAGVEFVMIRAGWRGSEQGVLTEDTYAKANLAGAAEVGLKVGAYMFSQAITPDEAVEEANFLLNVVKDANIQMPLVFDWEFVDVDARTGKMDAQTLTACTRAFCNTIQLAGYTPMIYFNTDQSYQLLELRELVEYPFWLAQYDTVLNYPYKIDMWQYTETGTVPGISTDVDINLYFLYEEGTENVS